MGTPARKPDPHEQARRSTATLAKAREAAREAVAKKNGQAHDAAVASRRKLDTLKAGLRKGLDF
jgi:hypothetical protein